MMKVILKVWNSVKDFSRGEDQTKFKLREHVKETLEQYKDTINYLEKYDKGEVSTPTSVVKHRDLQSYIRNL